MPVTYRETATTSYPAPAQAQRSVFIDADNDGDIDVLYQAVGDGTGWLYGKANGAGGYAIYSTADSPFSGLTFPNHNGANFFVMDVDGDGDMDIRAGANGAAGSYYRNDGNGDFTSVSTASFPVIAEFGRQAVGDFDGDGDADILYQTGGNGSAWSYAQSNGDGTYSAGVAQASSPFAALTLPDSNTGNYYVADFDGDGDVDVWAAADGGTGSYFRNDDGVFSSQSSVTFATMATSSKAVVADFDNDGDADILYQTGGAGSAWAYAQSNGDGTFTQMAQAASPFAGVTFVDHTGQNYRIGDINGDGRIDIVGGINGSNEEVYYQGSGGVVVNEVQMAGATAGDEFVELKNNTGADVDISGWTLVFRGATATSDAVVFSFPNGTIMPAGSHLLIANNSYDGEVPADFTFGAGAVGLFAAVGGGIGLREGGSNTSFLVDSVVWGTVSATHAFREGAGTAAGPGAGQSIERTGDTDTSGADWGVNPTPTPQRSPGPQGTVGDDRLDGDGDVDTINGLAGDDIINGGGAGDILSGGADNDSLRGDDGADTLNGDEGDDTLVGGAGTDTLRGGTGNDQLKGGLGADVMYGGQGDDHYHVTESGDVVIENGGEGYDTVHAYLAGGYSLDANLEALVIEVNGDILGNGNFLDNLIVAKAGNNTLSGSGGDDSLYGGAGDDTLNGGDDEDHLFGDAGNDQLNGGDGDDALDGGAGADTLAGGAGADAMSGGAGDDLYYVTDATDTVIEGASKGTDTVSATISHTLSANVETLILAGGGDLSGTGNGLNNVITGNGGDNVLAGLGGSDTLTGGAGADSFVFQAEDLRMSGLGETMSRDRILDFSLADGDRIDLSGIDAIAGGADDAFTVVAAFNKQAGQATLTWNGATDVTVLRLDVDGDGRPDHEVTINGHLTAGDAAAWIL